MQLRAFSLMPEAMYAWTCLAVLAVWSGVLPMYLFCWLRCLVFCASLESRLGVHGLAALRVAESDLTVIFLLMFFLLRKKRGLMPSGGGPHCAWGFGAADP